MPNLVLIGLLVPWISLGITHSENPDYNPDFLPAPIAHNLASR